MHQPALLWESFQKCVSFSQPFTRENIAQKNDNVNPRRIGDFQCEVERKTGKKHKKSAEVGAFDSTLKKIFIARHNILRYVNCCNYFYNRLCLSGRPNRISRFGVYIKNITIYSKKLSKVVVLGKRLDFFELFVIMSHGPVWDCRFVTD